MTKYEKIMDTMTVEMFAEILRTFYADDCHCCKYFETDLCSVDADCETGTIEWLKEDCEESKIDPEIDPAWFFD